MADFSMDLVRFDTKVVVLQGNIKELMRNQLVQHAFFGRIDGYFRTGGCRCPF